MSIEPKDTTHTATGVDDRSEASPPGGFAPILDLPDGYATTDTAMPPPPETEPSDEAEAPVASQEGHDFSAGSFEAFDAAPEPNDGEAAMPPPVAAAPGPASDDGVVFFGDDEADHQPDAWMSGDDADLILPIEPARLGSPERSPGTPWFAAQGASGRAEDREEADGTDAATVADGADVEIARPGADTNVVPVVAIIRARVQRATAPWGDAVRSFLTDADAGDITVPIAYESFVLLAASELVGVISDDDVERVGRTGASLELEAPRHAPLGVRFPVTLVMVDDEGGASTSDVGGVSFTAAAGAAEFAVSLDARVDRVFADEVGSELSRLAEWINRALEANDRELVAVTLDSSGGVRIEAN